MPRKAAWPPKIQWNRKRNTDRIRVAGQDYHLGPHDSPESRKRYAELIIELADARPPEEPGKPAAPTVATVAARWREAAPARYGADNPELAEYDCVLDLLTTLFPALPAADFDADRLEAVREEMVRRDWSRKVVNRRVSRVKTVWRFAERKKLVPAGSWDHLRALTPLMPGARGVRETEEVRACEEGDFRKVLDHLRPSHRTMMLFQWHTGCRPGEVRQLKVGEVDLAAGIARPARHKNAHRGHVRIIVLGEKAVRAIAPWLAGRDPEAYVFEAAPGTPYSRACYGNAVIRAARRAGVKIHCYQLRHAFRRRVGRECGLEVARAALGHRSVETTLGYASQQDLDLAREAARRIG